ncbi:AAA family ATPase [Streptomyces sp. NPDC039016]|uniref:ATP-dependent nuclease n=1 Tax=Streptomyces sp. NPDC039016 TaxID=3154330 RepID=UPI0033D47583
MHLSSFAVSGFRSLMGITGIPVSNPTILAGHNDGGKSAVLDALAFLVGARKLEHDDRTYLQQPDSANTSPFGQRCVATEVSGKFTLDVWEQTTFHLPARVELRRVAGEDLVARLELFGPMADDERLRSLSSYLVPGLKDLVSELGLRPASQRRADLEAALRTYAGEHSSAEGWHSAPAGLDKRMPRLLSFDGKSAHPDAAVKTALTGRFQAHMADPELTGRLHELEDDVKDRLRIDAKSLCDHIRTRCPDLEEVFVEPEISFGQGFRSAPLRLSRTAGEVMGLERAGLGRNRRVSLAIWEWTSELLADEENSAPSPALTDEDSQEPPPVQSIVVYDEPDTHLDYHHQRKIMQLIREQSALPHVNVMVATHSMNLIDGVDISDVVHLKLEEHRTVMERLGVGVVGEDIDRHLGQIAVAVGLRNSVLLHERCFLAVEGETEQRAFPLLFRLCEGLSLQAAGIALWACFNNEGALHLARYLAQRGRTLMLVVDADSRSVRKSIFKPAKLTEFFGTSAPEFVKFIGEPEPGRPGSEQFNELEEIFTDSLWAKIANKVWRRPGTAWSPEDFAALREAGKFSARVQELLQQSSPEGPGGKPEMMYELAMALDDPDDVPEQLRMVFRELRRLGA